MSAHHRIARHGALVAAGASVLLSSAYASAGHVSPPPPPIAVKQIAMPGEDPERKKQNTRAHGNKLKNKVKKERDQTASLDDAGPSQSTAPLSSRMMSAPETELPTYALGTKIAQ